MTTTNILTMPLAWVSRARHWLADRARMRHAALEISRMGAHELRDLGFSHTAAAKSGILKTDGGPLGQRSWIHAQPRFPRRDTCCN